MNTPLGTINHYRAEAAKLPMPQLMGERCVSPGGVPFQARVEKETGGGECIGWAPTGPHWTPLPLLFSTRML